MEQQSDSIDNNLKSTDDKYEFADAALTIFRNPQPIIETESQAESKPVHHDTEEDSMYYEEYCKLYCTSMIMAQKIKDLLMENCSLQNCIERINCEKKKYETMMIPGMFVPSDRNGKQLVRMIAKPKRHRRTKGEIQRKFRCSTKGCSKSYGSEGSLNQHIKLKHPESWANIINAGKVKKL